MKKILLLLSGILYCSLLSAQIPNANFDLWDSSAGYPVPVNWDSMDSVTHSAGIYTCEQASPGYSGPHCLKLLTKTIGADIVPGIAVSGKLDFSTVPPTPVSGFPISTRPESLKFIWQYMGFVTDTGFIAVVLTKWNTGIGKRDTISFTHFVFPPGMVMAWDPMTVYLSYSSGSYPDSGIIILSSSGTAPAANSYLYIDSLSFSGTMTTGFVNSAIRNNNISLNPNPANGSTALSYYSSSGRDISISISDLSGTCIYNSSFAVSQGHNSIPINLKNFAPRLYFVRITDEYGSETTKLMVQ